MNNTPHKAHVINAEGNHSIPVYLWESQSTPSGVIQIFHGLGEHAARYERFAHAATKSGYVVCAHNHRGHGPEAAEIGFFAEKNGWGLLVADARLVFEFLRASYAGLPIVLLGHSMGSFIAQSYAMRYADELAALILSGSSWPSRGQLIPGWLLGRVISWFRGLHGNSPLLDKTGFGAFNKPFEPARTEFDWLSRDPEEVDRYVADPLCGGPYTTGLWIDMLGGLLEISKEASLCEIRPDLPMLITGGADDPVGGDSGMRQLSLRYEKTGHHNLSTRIYDGGRHEMLNEINRDEFTRDVLEWTGAQLADYQA